MSPTETLELFPELANALALLLKSLSPSEWLKPSPINDRIVKDLVSHLIDGSLRRLSIQRDQFTDNTQKSNIQSYAG